MSHPSSAPDPSASSEPRPLRASGQHREMHRLLLGGFLLMMVLLLTDGFIGFRTIASIRGSVYALADTQFRNVALIDEVQRAQSALGSVIYRLSLNPDSAARQELPVGVENVEKALSELFANVPHDDPDHALWRDVQHAAAAMTSETNRILALPAGSAPDLTALFAARERLIAATSRLIRASHERAEVMKSQIGQITSYQFWEDGVLLTGCLLLACLCAWLVLRTATRLQRQLTEQSDELALVSWQLLEKQENLARRLSHELHDELGQSLTALKANLARHTHAPCADPAWLSDCATLLKDSIRNTHEISQLLRPTLLDDFGLDAALVWLCERFEERNGIEVACRSSLDVRLDPLTETHLFRIAQEALTNVSRHARASRVEVRLAREGDRVALHISDNGVGLPAAPDRSRPHHGLTGMRARARSLAGEMRLYGPAGLGTTIEVLFPWRSHEPEEAHPYPVG